MKKRVLCLAVALTLVIGLLAACGSKENNPPQETPTTATEPTAEATKEATKEATTEVATEDKQSSYVSKDPSAVKGDLTEWYWNQPVSEYLMKTVREKFPNLNYNVIVVPHADYMTKLQSAIAAGSEVPDIILGEIAFRGKIFDMNILEDLEGAPYNFDRSDIFDYASGSLLVDSNNRLVGLDQQMAPAGFAYRRDLTLKYLGTDDPEKVYEYISTWDKLVETGKKVQADSNGTVFMMAGLHDLIKCMRMQNATEWVSGNEVDLNKRIRTTIENGLKVYQSGVIGQYEEGTPAWNASFAKGDIMFYNCASWAPRSQMHGNDKDEGTGRWGLTKAPEKGFTLGGTSMSIYKGSKNKEAAWEYLKYIYLSKEGADKVYLDWGYIPNCKSYYADKDCIIYKQPGRYDEFFGGQNLAQYYVDVITPSVVGQRQTTYDTVLESTWNKVIPQVLQKPNMTADEFYNLVKSEFEINAIDAVIK